ncbi:DUF4251 domain-containing protein [Aequorivita antarctica]|uniref:DUF4251 domain-containing protein n=1 Tax=Aequorivita antarctica TaxID=153266 RepID=A0A5C6Z154_9FLAO|nr:DUF4251 domain-containing protein [Aequorivita antarctica]TXD73058.1 DUF4251 domain-containing protein [Aequorivita antarctica]SRX76181.1 hypothetical protein AEQU3_03180 [Aequorivita antarctica]
MKTSNLLFAVLFYFILVSALAQEKDIKASTSQETENTSNIENLLNSKTFEFVANTAFPISGTPKNLVGSGYSVTFSPEKIVSNLPFYGRAYGGMALGRDKGMRFQGKPKNFTIEKNKEYKVNTTVNDEGNTYLIALSVNDSGYASLTISSNDRGTISYQGEVK